MVREIQLRNPEGQRLYLNQVERTAFIEAARRQDALEHTFGLTLAMTGCRISEALALLKCRFDFDTKDVTFETLKKRKRGIFRSVPVPDDYLELMNLAHGLRSALRRSERARAQQLWPWSRTTAWRIVKSIMQAASIDGPHATPKGLRHAFAVNALESGVPLPLLQRWLGHASIETTAIYLQVVGTEARTFAKRMW